MSDSFEFALKWRSKLTKHVITHPLQRSERLLFVCTKPAGNKAADSSIFAFAAKTGGLVWEHTFENSTITGFCVVKPADSKHELCVLSITSNDFLHGAGEVLAFNPAGVAEWRIKLSDKTISAPVVLGDDLFVTDGGDSLTGISLASRQPKFEHPFGVKASLSAVALTDQLAIIPCRSGDLLGMQRDTGEVAWHFSLQQTEAAGREWLDQSPIIDGKVVYAASTKGRLVCVDHATGKLVWQREIESGNQLTQPAVGEHAIYVGGYSGAYALDKNSGKPLWKFETTRRVSAQPQCVGNLLFVAGEDHFVTVLNNRSGEKIASFEMDRRIEIPVLVTPNSIYAVDRAAELKVFAFAPELASAGADKIEVTSQNSAEEAERLIKAGDWLGAAKIYAILDDFPARAAALESFAMSIDTGESTDHDKATAWDQAADAFSESGDQNKREECKLEAARHRKQPIFELDLEESVLTLNSWAKLNYQLKNVGYGLARYIGVLVTKTGRFEWQQQTDTLHSLPTDRHLTNSLTVRPLNTGSGVPLDLVVEYIDVHDKRQQVQLSLSVTVLQSAAEAEQAKRMRHFDGKGVADSPIALRNIMVDAFSRGDLDDVIYEMDLNIDDFPGALRTATRDFIDAVLRQGRLDELLEIIVRDRPHLKSS